MNYMTFTNTAPISKDVMKLVGEVIFNIEDILEKNGLIFREKQLDIMYDITTAIESQKHVLIEAGVGIGKSLGYLIPGILLSLYTGRPFIITTSSIQLTEQLGDDIKLVEKLLSDYLGDTNIDFTIAKGRKNYPCEHKLQSLIKDSRTSKEYLEVYKKIQDGVDRQSPNGIDSKYWNKITEHTCDNDKSFEKENCMLYKMRNSLLSGPSTRKRLLKDGHSHFIYSPKVLIVNHNFFIAHHRKIEQNNSHGLLPSNPVLVAIDEIHNLEEKTRDSVTVKLSSSALKTLFKSIHTFFNDGYYNEILRKSNELYTAIDNLVEEINCHIKLEAKKADYEDQLDGIKITCEPIPNIVYIDQLLQEILQTIDIEVSRSNNANKFKERLADDIFEQLITWKEFINLFATDDTRYIKWGKIEGSKVSINYCLDNISHIINKYIFSKKTPTIGLSATITTQVNEEPSYEYIANNIGFDGDFAEIKESDFHYENSRLFIPSNLPAFNIRDEIYFELIAEQIHYISKDTNGGCLVLFTSKNDLLNVYNYLKKLTDKNILTGEFSEETKELIESFKQHKGILLGTGAFWEGIDLKKDYLTNLIIVRLPFPVPNPIIEKKIEKFGRNKVIIPEMITKFRQGVGRLIRTHEDIGVISILDSRLNNLDYPYRDIILKSIPIQNQLFCIESLKQFQNDNNL